MGLFKYKGASIHYTSKGKGRVVVLLHGFLENAEMWKDIREQLQTRFRVIAIDLLGHGNSENIGYIHTMEDQALMVKALLDSLQLRRYIVIGHSMGGYVGLSLAQLFPTAIKGLCLMNSTPLADNPEKKINRDRAIEAVKQNHKTFIRMSIPNLFASYNLTSFKNEINQVINEALNMNQQGIIASLEGMKLRKDKAAVFNTLKAPTQLIIGKNDGAIDYKATLKSIQNKQTEIVEFEDGHMSYIENKSELLDALTQFVKKCYK
ncbi:MAG: alpha/beta fold hydrolase [Bacteroidetes bacterium]|jgi:pimeloyl-ACP methyl ester carboxylesterase|nr:alpha/beta fold hydrolase [Bacteroidota bacterium]